MYQGNDLHHTMHISLKEALLGFTKTVKQLDGRDVCVMVWVAAGVEWPCSSYRLHRGNNPQVEVTQTSITKPMQVKVIKGEGMPHHNFPSDRGDMHVKVMRAHTHATSGCCLLCLSLFSHTQTFLAAPLPQIVVDFPRTLSEAQAKAVRDNF